MTQMNVFGTFIVLIIQKSVSIGCFYEIYKAAGIIFKVSISVNLVIVL